MTLRMLAAITPVLLLSCQAQPYPRVASGPVSGYDFEVQRTTTEQIHDAGVYLIKRAGQASRVGSNTEYSTILMDLENRSEFLLCASIEINTEYSALTPWSSGEVVMPPHSKHEAVAGITTGNSSITELRWTIKKKVVVADREGGCR